MASSCRVPIHPSSIPCAESQIILQGSQTGTIERGVVLFYLLHCAEAAQLYHVGSLQSSWHLCCASQTLLSWIAAACCVLRCCCCGGDLLCLHALSW